MGVMDTLKFCFILLMLFCAAEVVFYPEHVVEWAAKFDKQVCPHG